MTILSNTRCAMLQTTLALTLLTWPIIAEPFIDETTAFCYRMGLAPGEPFGNLSMLDQAYEPDVLQKVVGRPDTTHWCMAAEAGCRTQRPSLRGRIPCIGPECQRGYDLLQWPRNATCQSPRILFIHGGSWKLGSPWEYSYDVHTSKISGLSQSLVLSIDYPLVGARDWESGMEIGNFAGILNYSLTAWQWLAGHGPNGDPATCQAPMFIAGDSSGGGTAFSLLLLLNQQQKAGTLTVPMPAGALFESPWTNLKCNSPTYYSNNFGAWPNVEVARNNPQAGALKGDILFYPESMRKSGDVGNVGDPWKLMNEYALVGLQYCGCPDEGELPAVCLTGTCGEDKASNMQLTHWLASPYWAEPHHLLGLPPLYFVTSSSEVLAADTTVLADRAATAGVHVISELFSGMWHTFPQWSEGCGSGNPLWQGLAALQHMGDFVREVASATQRCPTLLRRSADNAELKGRTAAHRTYHMGPGMPEAHLQNSIRQLTIDLCGV